MEDVKAIADEDHGRKVGAALLFTGWWGLRGEVVNPDDVAVPLVVRGLIFRSEVFVATGLATREFLLFWAGLGSEDWDMLRASRIGTREATVIGTETTRRLFRASNALSP